MQITKQEKDYVQSVCSDVLLKFHWEEVEDPSTAFLSINLLNIRYEKGVFLSSLEAGYIISHVNKNQLKIGYKHLNILLNKLVSIQDEA